MIILRNLIKYNIDAQLILNPTNPGQAAFKGMSYALYIYLSLQKTILSLPTHSSIGVVASVPPVPGFGTAGINTLIPSQSILENLFGAQVPAPVPLNPFTFIQTFQSIGTWLSTPQMIASISPASVPPTMTGTGLITFPIIPILGAPCWATLTGLGLTGQLGSTAIEIRDNSLEMLSNFIYAGLFANFIAPIPTFGVAIPPVGPYSGITVPFFLMIDVPDFPVGSADSGTVDSALSDLGLSTLNDLETSALPVQDTFTVTTSDCDLVFSNDEFFKNPNCQDVFINENIDINQINEDFLNTSATANDQLDISTSAVDTSGFASTSAQTDAEGYPDFDATFQVSPVIINISVNDPIVSAVFVRIPEEGTPVGGFFTQY